METKHTPAPWYIKNRNGQVTATICRHDNAGERIAKIIAGDNAKQNAQLIASAPELLVALEWLLNDSAAERGTHTAITYANEVIAKARGTA